MLNSVSLGVVESWETGRTAAVGHGRKPWLERWKVIELGCWLKQVGRSTTGEITLNAEEESGSRFEL